MMAQKKEEKASVPPTPGFKIPRQPSAMDTEYAKLFEMTTKNDDGPTAAPTMEHFLEALIKSLTTATTKSSLSNPAKWNGKDAGYSKW